MEVPPSRLPELEHRLRADWSELKAAQVRALAKRAELKAALLAVDSDDTSIVVFGSLARNEFTTASDIDWTLLVDGAADPKHLDLTRRIAQQVTDSSRKPPGREGLFGSMTFSHDLVHQIGGEADTNRNATRRILLLLESEVIGRQEAYDRVLDQILSRYVLEDDGFVHATAQFHVPRFLLNDFARNWWTMTIDFAYKKRTRFGEGAAIRNIKLRFSRKLIYVSGLLACFGCHLALDDLKPTGTCPSLGKAPECIECLKRRLRRTPIDILVDAFLKLPRLDKTAKKILDSYNGFLGILANEHHRSRLEMLDSDTYEKDEVFRMARDLSHEFREGLIDLFFDEPSHLFQLTKNYGVF